MFVYIAFSLMSPDERTLISDFLQASGGRILFGVPVPSPAQVAIFSCTRKSRPRLRAAYPGPSSTVSRRR